MKKILFILLFSLIFSSCTNWIGNNNDYVISKIEYFESGNEYRVYIKGKDCKVAHYFYTKERYRVGDTLTIGLNKRDTIYE